ncbi:MAG: rRNA pseudouridine synthase [Alphaproteobacteria bacterium GM7ARS4]|nr:rRNA pseudouridine synthase [Alphaproteobacteria bacterium GM7ARS4]
MPHIPHGVEGDKPMRLAHMIAQRGLCSRRLAEQWIIEGRVLFRGKPITDVAFQPPSDADIIVNGMPLPEPMPMRLFACYKPQRVLTTTRDPQGRRCLFDMLAPHYGRLGVRRLMAVGRLDYMSEGLLLLTNDGRLARFLEHPTHGLVRHYLVCVRGRLLERASRAMRKGAMVQGFHYRPIFVEPCRSVSSLLPPYVVMGRQREGTQWLSARLSEGKNRELRNVLAHWHMPVVRLIRVAFGGVSLPKKKMPVLWEIPQAVWHHMTSPVDVCGSQ